MKRTFEMYKAGDGWRWRIIAANGNVTDSSTQGYSRRQDCVKNVERSADDLMAAFAALAGSKGEVSERL